MRFDFVGNNATTESAIDVLKQLPLYSLLYIVTTYDLVKYKVSDYRWVGHISLTMRKPENMCFFILVKLIGRESEIRMF